MKPRNPLDDLQLDPATVADFEARYTAAHGGIEDHCTAEAFTFNISGTPHSPWNLSSGRVFAKYFIEQEGLESTPDRIDAIREAFATRVKSLRAEKSVLDNLTLAQAMERQHRTNCNTRKNGVCQYIITILTL